ncbi:isochorismatase family protein [Streptomyces brasiliensis]|uniref:Isochorismatase-like domain-containing protein n=1 Tax=Streptomyces brasiliensis TaxID=1954 RepID=A0A917NF68_9ACTN|nr:isochorismatase family protein [Streptomyces brasiliensis]GGI95058.1 hypothetical protein GCM10010121_001820 [Streptomyces brasiliensis]
MTVTTTEGYDSDHTALLGVDPCTVFLSEGGKLWPTRAAGIRALSSSGFAHTDLDLRLEQHRVRRLALIGMRADTCIDTTARFGQELVYHVTLVRDAIAA